MIFLNFQEGESWRCPQAGGGCTWNNRCHRCVAVELPAMRALNRTGGETPPNPCRVGETKVAENVAVEACPEHVDSVCIDRLARWSLVGFLSPLSALSAPKLEMKA